jgi:serine/threonine protein kinase
MSPECQGDEFSTGKYSPMFNDVWSLGIILLNLATGRNPWKTATLSDETFCEYLRNPLNFFPSVLPISHEVNGILLRMLHVNWTERMTLTEVRQELEEVENFYQPDVVFDGSQARCLWEVTQAADDELEHCVEPDQSRWSDDSQLGCESLERAGQPSKLMAHYRNLGLPSFESDSDEALNAAIDLSSQRSLNSSLFSDSPSTPDTADISFANCYPTAPGFVLDGKRGREEGRATKSRGSSVLDPELPHRGISPFFYDSPTSSLTSMALHDHGGHGDDLWGSGSSSGASYDIRFVQMATPSPGLFSWPQESASAAIRVASASSNSFQEERPIVVDPIKFSMSRLQKAPSSTTGQESAILAHAPKLSQFIDRTVKFGDTGQGQGIKALKEVQANDNHRRKLSSFKLAKYWFSPSKLFF